VILFAVPGIMEPGLYFCHPLVRLPEFLLGAVLYRLSAMWEPADENRLAWTIVEIAALVAVVEMSCQSRAWDGALEPHSPLQYYVMGSAATPAFAACILIFSWQAGWAARAIGCAPLLLLGHSSYALYLVHVPLLQAAPSEIWNLYGELGPALKLVFYVALVSCLAAVSIALHLLIERPARNWLLKRPRRWVLRRAPQRPAPAMNDPQS
jgi:peptidoglycan/LPS O-acetylase OafA/YrhL